jgi:hypothetical protein
MSSPTIESIIKIYNSNVAALVAYCNNQITSIQGSNLRLIIKSQRIQQIRNFYNQNLQQLNKKRDSDIALASASSDNKIKALLVGIDYKGTSFQLNGCINDVESITQFLVSKNIKKNQIYSLTDNTQLKPTKENIINSLTKMLKDASGGDQLVFFYSGHGTTVNKAKPNVFEKFDDVLLTINFEYIVDDELNAIIQANLKPGVKLFVLFDCCHSGTMLDLKYNYALDTSMNTIIDTTSSDTKSEVYYISGCKDDQTSDEAFMNSKSQGALTWAFLQTVSNTSFNIQSSNLSWKTLVLSIRDNLKKYNFTQIPQFSSGLSCDVNTLWTFSK